jgi:hypothetical protein
MKTAPSTPYLLPPEDCVAESAWTLGDSQHLPDRLEHWDPYTDMQISRALEIDTDNLRDSCRLGPDSTFAVVASWYSNRTRLLGPSAVVELGELSGLVRAPVVLDVPGGSVGGRLALRTHLVLRHAGNSATTISPRREGSVLWTDEVRLALEGGASRFPITAIDFGDVPRLPQDGSWSLEWDVEQLDAPVMGAIRLVVNSRDEALVAALRTGSSDPRSSVVRSFVMFDVARTLVEGALANERFIEDPEAYDEGSLGRLLFELLVLCWPGVPIRGLATRAREDRGRLGAELQAYLGLLR